MGRRLERQQRGSTASHRLSPPGSSAPRGSGESSATPDQKQNDRDDVSHQRPPATHNQFFGISSTSLPCNQGSVVLVDTGSGAAALINIPRPPSYPPKLKIGLSWDLFDAAPAATSGRGSLAGSPRILMIRAPSGSIYAASAICRYSATVL